MVDLPEPVEPIIAMVSPLLALKDMFSKTYSSASGYLNETFLNSISPVFLVFLSKVPSLIDSLVSNTSITL